MEIILENKKHQVIYIDYYGDGTPHSVITKFWVDTAEIPYWRPVYWDLFPEQNDLKDIRAYQSGSGGDATKVQAPQWIDGFIGRYWIAECVEFEGTPKNAKRLKHPKYLKGYYENSRNPMKVAEIVFSQYYCDRCGYTSTEICDEHIYNDDDGNLRYRDDDSYAE
jgi:hypothetical protein